MEKYPEDYVIVDRPRPTIGYLSFMLILLGSPLLALPIIPGPTPISIIIVCGLSFAFLLYSAVDTKYVLDRAQLKVRSGFFSATIPVREISAIERTQFNRRVLGWAPGVRGYCNRLTNGIRFTASIGFVYISPTNPETFALALHECAVQANAAPPTSPAPG
jgi:hypothetical protein